MKIYLDKYRIMTLTAFILSVFSSIMTALGMSDLFQKGGIIIFAIFMVIDLGRFLLFNFLTDEWKNLRSIKYVITVILTLLFAYSAVGIFSQLSSMISEKTKAAMVEAAAHNKAAINASTKQEQSTDLAKIARDEYAQSISWNKTDYENCMNRAKNEEDVLKAENKCNNTKRWLDITASKKLNKALENVNTSLDKVEETVKQVSQNQSELTSILTSICQIGRMDCGTYTGLQNALSIVIILVIIGTDYLQVAIVLAVNTRKNKRQKDEDFDDDSKSGSILSKKKSVSLEDKPADILDNITMIPDKPKIVKKKKLSTKPSIKTKKIIPTKKTVKTITKIEEVKPEHEEDKLVKKESIVMSSAQEAEVNKLKEKLSKNNNLRLNLENAFDAAKKGLEKDSKNKARRPTPFTSETDFLG